MVYPHTYRTEHSETKTTNSTYGVYYASQLKRKIQIQPPLLKILQYVDSNRIGFLNNLNEAIQIRSISGELKYRNEAIRMIEFVEKWLVKLNFKYECFNIGYYELEGKKFMIPSVVLASLGRKPDPAKKTVCVYCYIDVKHPDKQKWRTDPWTVTEIDKRLYGCGTAGGKGPLISWFNTIEAFQKSNIEIPVNIKFVIESMHCQASEGLEEFLSHKRQDFFFDVDYVVVCDSEWIGEKYPCLTYGSAGLLHFNVTIEKQEKSTSDPRDDMKKIFSKICNDKEAILIPKFNDYVQQITPDEEQIYEAIKDFDVEEIRDSLPDYKKNWDKVKLLMYFWRLPSIWVDDIQECTCEKQDKTKIKRHFIIKIVPKQIVDQATSQVIQHINQVRKDLKLENKVDVELLSASRPWAEDFRSPNYEAARRATIQIYKEDPNMIKEDRDMKVVTILSVIIERNVLVLPLAGKNINAGGDNENMPKKNFYEGIKLLGAYLFQLSYVK